MAEEIFQNKEKPIPSGLTNVDKKSTMAGATYFLYYFGKDIDANKTFILPDGNQYLVDVIDTWKMTVEEKGIYAGGSTIEIPVQQYHAVRIYARE